MDSGGGTNQAFMRPGDRILQVPLEGTCQICGVPHASGVRNHEEAHVKATTDEKGRMPRLPKKLNPLYFNAVEDIRMDKLVREVAGLPQPSILCPANAPNFIDKLKKSDDRWRVLFATAAGEPDRKLMDEWLQAAMKDDDPDDGRLDFDTIMRIRDQVWNQLVKNQATIADGKGGSRAFPRLKDSIKTAKWLQDLLGGMGVDPDAAPKQSRSEPAPQGAPQPQHFDPQEALDGYDPDEDEQEALDPSDPNEYDPNETNPQLEDEAELPPPAQSDPNPDEAGSVWGDVNYTEQPLMRALPGRLRQTLQPTDSGTMPGDMSRWMTDQRIFKQMRRFAGGTVLVDCSGSMSVTQKQVFKWMSEFPGVTVATYNGDSEGYLWVVARKGRCTDDDHIKPPGGYNGIDGPALAWLGRQEGPRIWLSDGFVNGRSGSGGQHLDFQCEMIRRRFKIVHVNPHVVADRYDRMHDPEKFDKAITDGVTAALRGKAGVFHG